MGVYSRIGVLSWGPVVGYRGSSSSSICRLLFDRGLGHGQGPAESTGHAPRMQSLDDLNGWTSNTSISGSWFTWPGHGRGRRTAHYWKAEDGEMEAHPIWLWGTGASCIHSLRLAESKEKTGQPVRTCRTLKDNDRDVRDRDWSPTKVSRCHSRKWGGSLICIVMDPASPHLTSCKMKCWDWNHDCNFEATRAGGSPHCRNCIVLLLHHQVCRQSAPSCTVAVIERMTRLDLICTH